MEVVLTELRPLFPAIEPYNNDFLQVSSLHSLFYEEVGNPKGVPVVFLHGGPGVGAQPFYRRLFDPQQFRVVIFSQRGAGKSTPSGELRENTRDDLVEDVEKLRAHLQIDKWFVFGGSWGSTLGLSYAIAHPQAVRGLVLRGIYLGRPPEQDWLYKDGASRIFPESWERFLSIIPEAERDDLPAAYYRRLISSDKNVQIQAANHWYDWEDEIIRLLPRQTRRMDDTELLAYARIECHYMVNKLFLPNDNFLLENAHKIAHIPCWIAQGRYDIVCPATTALDLSRALPNSILNIVPDAGHSISEPGLVDCLIKGIETLTEQG
jgi:proline iminopeptidase